jgi:hypothetical protein
MIMRSETLFRILIIISSSFEIFADGIKSELEGTATDLWNESKFSSFLFFNPNQN